VWLAGGGAGARVLIAVVAVVLVIVFSKPRFSLDNMSKIKVGMSQKEVEGILGPGTVVSQERVPIPPDGREGERKIVRWEDDKGQRVEIEFTDDKSHFGFGRK
jgi:hypothetical protein